MCQAQRGDMPIRASRRPLCLSTHAALSALVQYHFALEYLTEPITSSKLVSACKVLVGLGPLLFPSLSSRCYVRPHKGVLLHHLLESHFATFQKYHQVSLRFFSVTKFRTQFTFHHPQTATSPPLEALVLRRPLSSAWSTRWRYQSRPAPL